MRLIDVPTRTEGGLSRSDFAFFIPSGLLNATHFVCVHVRVRRRRRELALGTTTELFVMCDGDVLLCSSARYYLRIIAREPVQVDSDSQSARSGSLIVSVRKESQISQGLAKRARIGRNLGTHRMEFSTRVVANYEIRIIVRMLVYYYALLV